MSFDISPLLEQWDYQPGKLAVRKFVGQDGTEKIQLRVDLGVMQMNATGRPDGKKPFGHVTLREHFSAQRARVGDGFRLSAEDCGRLQQELIQFHHCYICLFQLEEFDGVLQDTEHNLRAMEFAAKHAASPELVEPLKQFLPQLLMLQTRARGTIALEAKQHGRAVEVIEAGLEALRAFHREQGQPELAVQSNEIQSLENWLIDVRAVRPVSEREKLESDLAEAVASEDYEKAAAVRDALRHLK